MKVEAAIQGFPSIKVLETVVSVDVKQRATRTLNGDTELRSCVKVEVDVLGSPVPNSPYGLCGIKAEH